MAFEKQGDATGGTVLHTATVNTTPFVTALVAHGCTAEEADGVASC